MIFFKLLYLLFLFEYSFIIESMIW